jgi:uncharacterized protein with HEPN domain
MKNRDSHYVQRIIEYCLKIEDILNSIDYDYDVFTGEVYQLASSMCIVQIGENVGRLSDEFKERYDNIPWRDIKGMRNITTHKYDNMDVVILWNVLVDRIPELKDSLIEIKQKM